MFSPMLAYSNFSVSYGCCNGSSEDRVIAWRLLPSLHVDFGDHSLKHCDLKLIHSILRAGSSGLTVTGTT